MSQVEIDILKRALVREKAARKAAEKILEKKSADLYTISQQLKESNTTLEKLVREKTSELKGVFENIIDAYVVVDFNGDIIKMNDPAIKLLGFDNSIAVTNVLSLIDVSETENSKNAFQTLLQEGHLTNFEIKVNTKSNTKKLVHINASVILDENNTPIAAQGILRDITKSREAEKKLIDSENRLSSLMLNLDSGILLEDENRKIVLTNNKFCELFDIQDAPESLKGMDCAIASQYTKKMFADPDTFLERSEYIYENGTSVLGDELTMLDGRILERDFVTITAYNETQSYLWMFTDVSINRRYRKSLESQRQKYRNIITNMNLGLIEVDNDDIILLTNQSFLEMSGYTESELLGKKAQSIFLVDNSDVTIRDEKLKRKQGISSSYELKVKIKSGENRIWLISGATNYDMNGEVIGSIGIHLDITDLKKLQLQKESLLIELEKSNDELQEYAHIVSHDLKSPLRSIDALINWIKEDNKDKLDDVSLQNFALIETTLEKMELLISDVLEYSSVGFSNEEKTLVNLNDLAHGLIEMMYKPDHVKVEVLNTLPSLHVDETKLQQLFQNLISNAIKFIDKDEGFVKIKVEELPTHYQFSVQDNGMGIEAKFHDKVFKIFHTLNKSKDSTGIGLSIVKKIVGLHDGRIWFESEPKKGSTFFFTLKK